jgi:hypothetical protein
MTDGKGEIIIYDEIEGKPRIEVKLADDTLWLSQRLMADLFEKDVDTISLHIKNIYAEAELEQEPATTAFTVAQQEGKRTINRKVAFYNLDMILSVGYRVSSKRGTAFRKWANTVLMASGVLSSHDDFATNLYTPCQPSKPSGPRAHEIR